MPLRETGKKNEIHAKENEDQPGKMANRQRNSQHGAGEVQICGQRLTLWRCGADLPFDSAKTDSNDNDNDNNDNNIKTLA